MTRCYVRAAVCSVMSSPSQSAVCISEALYGECIEVIKEHDGWVKARQMHDGYTGFIKTKHLLPQERAGKQVIQANTHWVHARSTLLFKEPDFKSPVTHRLSFASELRLQEIPDSSFSRTDCGHYVWTAHCLPLDQRYPTDPLALAQSHFLGAPYRWGGRSTAGVDCSGLVQMLARACGISIPRDSSDQEQHITHQVRFGDYRPMDLAYWPGHTAILMSSTHVLHATAFSLDCRIETLNAVTKRAGALTSVRRLFDSEELISSEQP